MNGMPPQPQDGPQIQPPRRRSPIETAARVGEYVRAGVVHCGYVVLAAAALAALYLSLKGLWFLVEKVNLAMGGS